MPSSFFISGFSLLALSSASPLIPRTDPSTLCQAGQIYYAENVSSSGYMGCASPTDKDVCAGQKRFWGTCNGNGNFFVCNNGFKGCNTNNGVCDVQSTPTTSTGAPPNPPVVNEEKKWTCPAGTVYYPKGSCSSGFVGCAIEWSEVCHGNAIGPGECPSDSGSFFNCANGFVGCTTSWNICG